LGLVFEERNWLEDTIVVVVTDHGEEFGDHGDIMHRYSVHQELARAGLLIRVPGFEPRRTAIPAHHTDLLPTLLEVLDLRQPETVDGIALLSTIDAAPFSERPLLTCRTGKDKTLWGLTVGKWRLLQDEPSGTVELYDVERDPQERIDLAVERPEVLADLQQRLALMRSELQPVPREHVTVDLNGLLNSELARLGYAGDEE
jgi:arylsulfatase A-like enzyme